MVQVNSENKNIDALDRKIILALQKDARRPYKDIATKLRVSEGTIKNSDCILLVMYAITDTHNID